jgi:hypothetical protein
LACKPWGGLSNALKNVPWSQREPKSLKGVPRTATLLAQSLGVWHWRTGRTETYGPLYARGDVRPYYVRPSLAHQGGRLRAACIVIAVRAAISKLTFLFGAAEILRALIYSIYQTPAMLIYLTRARADDSRFGFPDFQPFGRIFGCTCNVPITMDALATPKLLILVRGLHTRGRGAPRCGDLVRV